MLTLPNRIFFVSDETTAELMDIIKDKKSKDLTGNYKFTTGKYIKDKEVPILLSHINHLKSNNLLKILS